MQVYFMYKIMMAVHIHLESDGKCICKQDVFKYYKKLSYFSFACLSFQIHFTTEVKEWS